MEGKNIIDNNIISIPFISLVHITHRDLIIFWYLCLFRVYFFISNLFKDFLFNICLRKVLLFTIYLFRGFLFIICLYRDLLFIMYLFKIINSPLCSPLLRSYFFESRGLPHFMKRPKSRGSVDNSSTHGRFVDVE